jgi:hypothetical protein
MYIYIFINLLYFSLVKCPTNAIAALTHPYYILYTGKIWQSNSICFQLNTQVFYDKKKQQVNEIFLYTKKNLI